tara:strand:- start:860 stop:1045 length:186 start_codon:yes stop_codon:yes gene_type:complete
MANQYSITVSNGADAVLKELKQKGVMTSQAISEAVFLLGTDALLRLVANRRFRESIKEESE